MAIEEENKIGSVLVIGGGVAGLTAAMDLASSGRQVYLAERAPMLGGLMPQLDKTFPTNDCAMCFIAPKEEDRSGCLRGGVAVWRHCNVRVLPDAEVKSLAGEAGNFRAVVETRPVSSTRPRARPAVNAPRSARSGRSMNLTWVFRSDRRRIWVFPRQCPGAS